MPDLILTILTEPVMTSLEIASSGYYSVAHARWPRTRTDVLVRLGWLSTDWTTSRGSRESAHAISAHIGNAACSTRRGGQGRSAFYDDYHLSQLKTINQLLRKGFNSAHIAEFFARMREGHDLAAILGVQQAILGRRADGSRAGGRSPSISIPECDEAQRLVSCGLAELVENSGRARPSGDGRDRHALDGSTLLRSDDPAGGRIDRRHDRRVGGHAGRRAGGVPSPRATGPATCRSRRRWTKWPGSSQDYRDLGIAVVTHLLDKALQRHMVSAVSDYTTGIVAGGRLDSRTQATWLTPASSRDRRRTAGPATPG